MPRRSAVVEWTARYAIETGGNMLLATMRPEWWYQRLKELYPNAKLKRTGQGVIINPKSE